jgi:regulator of replication initiation timing
MGKKKDTYLKRQADKLINADFKEQYEDSVRRAKVVRKKMIEDIYDDNEESVEEQSYTDISMRCLSGRIERLTKLYKEIEREIGNIKEDLAEIQKSKEETIKEEVKIQPQNKRWRAKLGEPYWHLTEDEVYCDIEYDTSIDYSRYILGNYFKTKKEAELEYQRLKVINELKAWSTDKAGIQFIIGFTIDKTFPLKSEHELKVMKSDDYLALRFTREPVYFYTKEDAENAIKAVGEDRILKYYFIKDLSNNKEEEN